MTVYVVRCEDIGDNHTIGVYDNLDKAIKEIRKNAHDDTKILGIPEKEIKTIRKVFDKWEKSLKNGLSSFTESPCVAKDSDIYYSIEKFEIK